MAIERLGASHLASEGFEVQRTNNFEIQVSVPTLSDTKTRILRLAVVSGFLPNESNEVITLGYGNTSITVAGKSNFHGNGSLVVRDLVQQDVEQMIDDWRSMVTNKDDDSIGFAFDYKQSAKITQSAPDGTLIRVWDLEGVWPQAVDYGQISYESAGVKTISITLQYDKAKINRKDYNSIGVTG